MISNAKQWLTVDRDILFILTPMGRIVRENDPGHSSGPRLWLAGSAGGNVLCLADSLPRGIAAQIEGLAASEPPFVDPDVPPVHVERYLALLAGQAPVDSYNYGRIYDLPHGLTYPGAATLVGSDSEAGEALLRRLARDGMPAGLVDAGFRSLDDFWAPWCVAMLGDEIVAIAFAARLAEAGAELGVTTVESFRGQGFAAAATAGWSSLPALGTRALFYSHDARNRSSRRVTQRLGLACGGASLRIY